MALLELGRPARIGHIVFGTGEGSFSVEKNLEEHFIGIDGEAEDGRLLSGTVAWEAQFRNSETARFRYSWVKGLVAPASKADGFWTAKPNIPEGESGISTFSEKVNLYFASSAANTILEIRVWASYT